MIIKHELQTSTQPVLKSQERIVSRDVYGNGTPVRHRVNATTGIMGFKQRQIVTDRAETNKPINANIPSFIGQA